MYGWYKAQSLRTKLTLSSFALTTVLIAILFSLYAVETRRDAVAKVVETNRSVAKGAVGVAAEMEKKWDSGIFSIDVLRA